MMQRMIEHNTDIGSEIEKLPCWSYLSADEKEYVRQNSVLRSYEKGEFLKGPNVSCLGMVCVISGSVRSLMRSEDGREITLFRLNPGDSCVLSASCVLSQLAFETEMVAGEKTRVLVVDSGAYAALMEKNLNVKCFSYELALERSSVVIGALQQIIFDKFNQRLARYLLSECERTGKKEITMTKEAIAREVNTAREVVSRTLKQFSDEGLIRMSQKTIVVLDESGLREMI